MNVPPKLKQRDGAKESLWQSASAMEKMLNVSDIGIYDVAIVGAGITGVSTALKLQQAGKRCLILEGNTVGFGATGGTTAHLNTFFDATYPEIESDFGEDAAKIVAEAGMKTIENIENQVANLNIDCDFEEKPGYLFSETEEETEQLQKIMESSKRAGILVTEANKNDVSIGFRRALMFAKQAQFHPLKYVNGILKEFIRIGGKVKENTFVRSSSVENGNHKIETDGQDFLATHLVYATHIPPGINLLNFRCAPYRSYALGLKLKDESQHPEGLAYDMQEPYHYFRSHTVDNKKYLIIGGEDHKTGHGNPEEAFENLRNYATKYYDVEEVSYRWSSQYYVPVDGLPYIGKMPYGDENTYVATGFNGNGMIFGTLSAEIITDTILEKENKFAKLFDPERLKPIAGFTEFVKENADVAYRFIADRFGAEKLTDLMDINAEEGKIVELDGEKLAVYKDKAGKITALNPVCTHAKCIVNFNSEEKSWDCPCHGGRFDLCGKVITGPPRQDLEQVSL
ncbi:MAG: FAD-dependent oxidoreductase [Flavobacteriales bacterium]|nr:MAG: FAD-dependent oxidoreductase [Flavobacteriales bacterium]